jgi:hypothetical protein
MGLLSSLFGGSSYVELDDIPEYQRQRRVLDEADVSIDRARMADERMEEIFRMSQNERRALRARG